MEQMAKEIHAANVIQCSAKTLENVKAVFDIAVNVRLIAWSQIASLFLSNVLKTLFQEVAVLLCVLFVSRNSPSLGELSHGVRAERCVELGSNGLDAPIHRTQPRVLFVSPCTQPFSFFFFLFFFVFVFVFVFIFFFFLSI